MATYLQISDIKGCGSTCSIKEMHLGEGHSLAKALLLDLPDFLKEINCSWIKEGLSYFVFDSETVMRLPF